jgi:hypothetical protein
MGENIGITAPAPVSLQRRSENKPEDGVSGREVDGPQEAADPASDSAEGTLALRIRGQFAAHRIGVVPLAAEPSAQEEEACLP